MRLFNSLTKSVEEFTPARDRPVHIYICGITPYDSTHLGHVLTYASGDVLIRFLEYLGHEVRYVQNLTDIDDAILRASSERDEDWKEPGDRWTGKFIEDMQTLNIRPPDVFPRATEHIPQMIERIGRLIEAGVAYESQGAVYYSVEKWGELGRLSGLEADEMLEVANEHGNDPEDPRKRDPLDFALWKAHQEGEPSWESPWGPGRPGWHIECSTLAGLYLDDQVDIHGGGSDLSFPHHEAEIAQSEPVSDSPFARFWFHTGMLEKGGEKMSKSVGNLVMMRDLLDIASPNGLRLYFAHGRYREDREYSEEELRAGEALARKIESALPADSTGESTPSEEGEEQRRFQEAMEDDLNTPEVLRVMAQLTERILETRTGGAAVDEARAGLLKMGRVLGLMLPEEEPEERVVRGWKEYA